jgi:hypothetical protein
MFLAAEKRGVSSPHFTTNPPHSHRQKTTFCTPLFSKTPAKTPLHDANIFFSRYHKKIPRLTST